MELTPPPIEHDKEYKEFPIQPMPVYTWSKPTALDADFESTIGDDIAVCVKGDYTPVDRSVGIDSPQYCVTHVWLPSDLQQVNILSLTLIRTGERLSCEGAKIMSERG